MTEFPSFFELLGILRRYWLWVLTTTVMGLGLAAVMVFFIIRPTYEAQTSLLLTQKTNNTGLRQVMQRLESQVGSLGGLSSFLQGAGGFESSAKAFKSILTSRRIVDPVVQKSQMAQLTDVQEMLKEVPAEQVPYVLREYLLEHVDIDLPDHRQATLRVSVRLKDKEKPAQIANLMISELERFLNEHLYSTETRQKASLKKQLATLTGELKSAEEALLAYQKKYQRVALSEETTQYIKSQAETEANVLAAQAELKEKQAQLQSLTAGSQELMPQNLEQQNELRAKIQGLTKRLSEFKQAQFTYRSTLRKIPSQALELARLKRQVELKNQLYMLVNQQYQTLLLTASEELKLFEVLDPAIPAFEPVSPSKKGVLGISGIISICLGAFLSLTHYFAKQSKEPTIYATHSSMDHP